MPTKIIKRLQEDGRTAHFLLRELLVYSLDWTGVYANPLAVFESPSATGTDGEVSSDSPNRFLSPSGVFNAGHIGLWLTVYDSNFNNNGVYRIVGLASSSELVLEGGVYGSSFMDDTSISWRIVDPSLSVGAVEYVVQGRAGSATPLWQASLAVAGGVTDTIDIQVSPNAGWSGSWTVPTLPVRSVTSDTTPVWYILVDDTHVRIWSQDNAGTGVFELAYFGAGESRRPADDDRFVCSLAGSPTLGALGALSSIDCLDDSLATQVTYSAITYGDVTQQNMFTSLPASDFDLRWDHAKVAIGTEQVGYEEDNRGYLRGIRYISDQIPYRSFVDNGRQILSLGNGLGIEWDGSLSR